MRTSQWWTRHRKCAELTLHHSNRFSRKTTFNIFISFKKWLRRTWKLVWVWISTSLCPVQIILWEGETPYPPETTKKAREAGIIVKSFCPTFCRHGYHSPPQIGQAKYGGQWPETMVFLTWNITWNSEITVNIILKSKFHQFSGVRGLVVCYRWLVACIGHKRRTNT